MYLVDSSVWIALFLDDDTQHAKAVAVMARIRDGSIQVPYGVILETATVLARKQSKEQANKFVEFVRSSPQIEIVSPFSSRDIEIFLKEPDRLSFVDIILKEMTWREGSTLISFDQKLVSSLTRSRDVRL
ncbi:hypothetical protein A3A38_03330 [Candidatus Kaiserbacteria bacterium RIFCSPLOWO2_01_FULL_53_17]|uniref:PIN domain-containing protein n=1 Tax=Candidatus Kaiserbacteria bacterium RIFCSPLOWO2_01_FULL_53_17 TaxID=1798511 RepID=A0A1F6EHN9_9BACT|nr:MAG: hypothetical protein A3A38_03330 [Candidatus Kaiserbacteria bacterium RIFCSPLOWO2_01_FULL_53_17]